MSRDFVQEDRGVQAATLGLAAVAASATELALAEPGRPPWVALAWTVPWVAATAASGAARGQAQVPHPHHHDPEHGDCLKACRTAAEVCNETFHHSFARLKDGHAGHAKVAGLTIDCQDLCALSAARAR